jgi:uroporphyrinogen-III synthase
MLPLDGIGVLVTRPQHQATPLCRLLQAQGAVAHPFAAINILPVGDRASWAARAGRLEEFQLAIFSSANAVRFGAALLDQRRDLAIAAIGPATARALTLSGHRVSVQPAEGFDSESLLRHPRLNAMAGGHVLLITGAGGRDLLRQELVRRGAQVTVVEVYRRERRLPRASELAALEAQFSAGAIQVVTSTSAEIAASLLALATPALRRCFNDAEWLVPGSRVARSLRELGHTGGILEADSADDQDLVSALVRWRAGESGA